MAAQWLQHLSHKTAHVRMLNPVYQASLRPLEGELSFTHTPPDLFPGDAGRGRWVTMGKMDINGYRLPFDQEDWMIGTSWQSTPFFEKCHGFGFLTELKALGGDAGRKTSRAITAAWLDRFKRYDPHIWSIPLTAERIYHWLVCYPFAFETAADAFLADWQDSLYKHYQHLVNSLKHHNRLSAAERFDALWAVMIVQSHCEDLYDEMEYQSLAQLVQGAIEDLTFPHGGLRETRSLNDLMRFAKACIILRHAMQMAGKLSPAVPVWLDKQIEITVRTLNILTHSDKDLVQFQGTYLLNALMLEKMNRLSKFRFRRNDTQMAEYGYSAMRKGRTSIMVDHGYDRHVAPLAFEMGYAGHRLIVSCGAYHLDPQWQQSLSSIAAHSAVDIDSTNPRKQTHPVASSLDMINGAVLFSGTHDGYHENFGLKHTRRIYLDSKGEDVRGEDILARNMAIKPLPLAVRFHLHPNVKASLTEDRHSILMRLPSGAGFVFQCNHGDHEGAALALDDSIHCADGFHMRKTNQIVMTLPMTDVALTLKWAIKKV